MDREQLQAELDRAKADLEDLEELKRGFLEQTGLHMGLRDRIHTRRQFGEEEARLKERIALLEKLINSVD